MKKIIAILLALAVVSTMAFAQSVSVTNTLSTNPTVTIDGGANNWSFDPVLNEKVEGSASTADGRATIGGMLNYELNWQDPTGAKLLTPTPRWRLFKRAENYKLGFGAALKPFDHFEVVVTTIGWNPWRAVAGPGIQWKNDEAWWAGGAANFGGFVANNMSAGIYATYSLLDDKLWLAGGWKLNDDDGKDVAKGRDSWIKKGAYGPFQAGVNFKVTDDVAIGARWEGQFGGFDDAKSPTTDKKWYSHGIYAGADLNMFKDAKVGTTIGVGFAFQTQKASQILGKDKDMRFAGSVKVGFDFRNSISDTLWVTVGYRNANGVKSKRLPFGVGNTLKYQVSDDASFSFETIFQTGGATMGRKSYADGEFYGLKDASDADKTKAIWGSNTFTGLFHVYPEFSFKLGGKHTFTFGVDTDVITKTAHYNKTNTEWAYSAVKGIKARVSLPISWAYTF